VTPPGRPPEARRRRGAVLALSLVFLCAGGGREARAEDRPEAGTARDGALERARRSAIRNGCRYIKENQRSDGGWGENKAVVAITSLCLLALMADGSTDGRGPYGAEVTKGLDFLLRLVDPNVDPDRIPYPVGYFHHPQDNNSRMHGQGYATLAVATALGTSSGERYRDLRAVLAKAVECIEGAQTGTGGFGYEPRGSADHEGSVTVTVAQGLRAARDAGLLVDYDVVKRGLRYLKRSQNDAPGSEEDGSFRYSIYVPRSSYALTAAAVSSFFLYGEYADDPDRTIQRGLDYMMRSLDLVTQSREWWYYGNFYAAWTTWQKDGDRPDLPGGYWARWHRHVYPILIRDQRAGDGGWADPIDRFNFGDLLATAFAVLTLAIPDETLPVFQR
jgi:hypothetical protein